MALSTVRAEKLAIGYEKKTVCKEMNFSAPEGKITCLMGSNGAGKSTLLKTIAGLLPNKKGEIYLFDKKKSEYKRNMLSKVMSVVLTDRISVDFMTAMEIVKMGRYPHTGFLGKLLDNDRSICLDSLKKVNAESLKDRVFSTLSDGEKQKVLIARAIAQQPKIILLDEPTTHLDIKHKLETMNLLNRLVHEKNITVILSLHELDLAIKACHKIISIKDGRIVYDGTPENMNDSDKINDLFDMDADIFSHITGSVEIRTGASTDIFVAACGGTGTDTYRVLAKNRLGFTTGIIFKNDTDYHIVKSMGAGKIALKPFERITEKVIEGGKKTIDKAKIFIDTGFEINDKTLYNRKLIQYAIDQNKKIISLRDKREFEEIFGAGDAVFTKDISNFEWSDIL